MSLSEGVHEETVQLLPGGVAKQAAWAPGGELSGFWGLGHPEMSTTTPHSSTAPPGKPGPSPLPSPAAPAHQQEMNMMHSYVQ